MPVNQAAIAHYLLDTAAWSMLAGAFAAAALKLAMPWMSWAIVTAIGAVLVIVGGAFRPARLLAFAGVPLAAFGLGATVVTFLIAG